MRTNGDDRVSEGATARTALVTGATGFIGGHLAARLVAEGWSVRVLARHPDKLPDTLRGAVEVVQGDLIDSAALRRAVRDVAVIFHCAGNVQTWDRTEAYQAANVHGVRNLLAAARESSPALARFVHFSSVDVYGFPAQPCDEHCALNGGGFGYGESKLAGERAVAEFCRAHGMPGVIIRPCNVIGPGSPFISRIGDELRAGLMLKIAGGRSNAGLLYIDNLLDWTLWAATSETAIGQCYNMRDNYDASWAEFINRLRGGIGGRGIVISLPFWLAEALARGFELAARVWPRAGEPLLHRLIVRIFGRTCGHRADRLFADSGIRSRVGFDEAMRRSIDWFLTASDVPKR